MSTLVLDAGALVAVDRGDRAVLARLRAADRHGVGLRTNAIVVAQVWRGHRGRQATLAKLLAAVDIRAVDEAVGRAAGVLLAQAGTSDPIDATVVLLAEPGDRILTGDPDDLTGLAVAAKRQVVILGC
ncbi:MAG TPA: hypothetical protein VG165_14665 [Solirubrobacteraceae bacterium]|jgi:hypothetical protein|nr:hypothetical protein [Solirubrobacteraceae bacterium]